MKNKWASHFKDKKITIQGLGLLGRGINVAKFLLENGATLTITDLKTEEKLTTSLKELAKHRDKITYILGQHRLEDFQNADMVIKAPGVPLDSPFVEEARKNNIPIEMDASLFARLAPKDVTIIGITGTRGKSTTTSMIASILKTAGKRVHLGGNIRGLATLPLLNEVTSGDYVVLELDSWQLQGFGEAKISPTVAVFTNLMPDHMNYYKNDMDRYFADKANIFLHQNKDDILVAGKEVTKEIKKKHKPVSRLIQKSASDLPSKIKLQIPGEHNRGNAVLAFEATKSLGISDDVIIQSLESFSGVEGRLQFVGEKNGVKIYNDNNATTADATTAALVALGKDKNIILIVGGADKGLDMAKLVKAVEKYCRAVVLLSGTGTEKIKPSIELVEDLAVFEFEKLEDCFEKATKIAKRGDILLFSPAFASFSKFFQNEYERNDLFLRVATNWLKKRG